jgi:hypothetical protein
MVHKVVVKINKTAFRRNHIKPLAKGLRKACVIGTVLPVTKYFGHGTAQ